MSSRKTKLTSRFSHFYHDDFPKLDSSLDSANGSPGSGAMFITAGIGFRSETTSPAVTGSFVSSVATRYNLRQTTSTIIRPDDFSGDTKVITNDNKPQTDDVIGHVIVSTANSDSPDSCQRFDLSSSLGQQPQNHMGVDVLLANPGQPPLKRSTEKKKKKSLFSFLKRRQEMF